VLIKYGDLYAWPVYEPATGSLLSPSPVHLLSLIAASQTTPTALVSPDQVEEASHACISEWCRRNGVGPEAVQRVCALYLKPEHEDDTMHEWLDQQQSVERRPRTS